MRRALLILAAIAALATVGCGAGEGPASARTPEEAARAFLDRYVASDGRVVRLDQGGDTVSEGQAYAMLVAVQVGDRRRFDLAWGWARRHLQRRDRLLSWHWKGGKVVDPQPAADADLDAAHALALGARRFHSARLRAQARALGRAILRHETAAGALVAGPWARAARIANPSYLDPNAALALARLGSARRWKRVSERGVAAAVRLTEGARRLPPDWSRRGGATAPPGAGGAPSFGYDAVRLPIRFASGCVPRARRLAAALWPTLRAGDPAVLPRALDGAPGTGAGQAAVALVAAAAAAHAAGDDGARDRLLDQADALDAQHPSYYGAAWIALGRLGLRGACRA